MPVSRKASMDIAMDLVSRRRERPFGIGPFVVDLTEIQSTAQLVAYTRGVLVAPGPRVIDILEFRDSFDSAPDQRTFKNPFTVLIGAHHKFDEQNRQGARLPECRGRSISRAHFWPRALVHRRRSLDPRCAPRSRLNHSQCARL